MLYDTCMLYVLMLEKVLCRGDEGVKERFLTGAHCSLLAGCRSMSAKSVVLSL